MTNNPQNPADAEALAKEITDKAFALMREHSGKPFTPELIKQSMLAVMAEYKERDLEDGVDYRIEAEGARITITPISPRCIEWFARCQRQATKQGDLVPCGGCGKSIPYGGGPNDPSEELCDECCRVVAEMKAAGEL